VTSVRQELRLAIYSVNSNVSMDEYPVHRMLVAVML
jgi:hypothetical protein